MPHAGSPVLLKTVAVIIPAYNAAPWLAEAIESVLAQTVAASSIVVVDDGSTDDTLAVAGKFGDAIRLLTQSNEGVSVARNRGSNQVSADGLLFLDADDRLRPEAIARLTACATQKNYGVVYGETWSFGDGTRQRAPQLSCEGLPPAATIANFWKSVPSSPGAVLMRSEIFHNAGGFDPALSTAADRALWLRLGAETTWGHVAEVVLERREHPESMVRDRARARTQAAQAQLTFLDWCRAARPGMLPEFPNEGEVFHRNLLRALDERQFDAVQWLSDEAARRKVEHATLAHARRLLTMPALVREAELKLRTWLKA
jgi:hypothetical protein